MRPLRVALSTIVVLAILTMACAPAAPTTSPTKPSAASASPSSSPVAAKPSAPAASTTAPVAKVKRGSTIQVVVDFTWPTMDPHLSNWGGRPSTIHIFDALVGTKMADQKTGKLELIPELAESWKLTDATTIDMVLQRGVKFHDGSDFNAEVAKWNLERIINHPKSQHKMTLVDIAGVETTGDYGLRLKLKEPSASILLQLSHAASGTSTILSKAAIDKNGEEAFQSNPSGTGAMRFDRWVRDDRVSLKRFDGYWKKGADGQALPYLDGLVERFMPDKSVAFLELRTGNVDAVAMIDPKDVAAVKKEYTGVSLLGADMGRYVLQPVL